MDGGGGEGLRSVFRAHFSRRTPTFSLEGQQFEFNKRGNMHTFELHSLDHSTDKAGFSSEIHERPFLFAEIHSRFLGAGGFLQHRTHRNA